MKTMLRKIKWFKFTATRRWLKPTLEPLLHQALLAQFRQSPKNRSPV